MKYLFLFSFLIISTFSFSQIQTLKRSNKVEIGRVGPMGKQNLWCERSGDLYTFYYKDMKSPGMATVKSFAFKDIDNAFNNLYEMIMDGFKEMPIENTMVKLPKDVIWLHYEKIVGATSFQFWHGDGKKMDGGVSQLLTRAQVQKLFGKR